MKTHALYTKSIYLILAFVLSGCGLTPAEQARLKKEQAKKESAREISEQRDIARLQFAEKRNIVWEKNASINFENIEKGSGLLWQSKSTALTKEEAKNSISYCKNKTIYELGLPIQNFRLPTSSELAQSCKNDKILIRNPVAFYVASENVIINNYKNPYRNHNVVKTSYDTSYNMKQCEARSSLRYARRYIKCVKKDLFDESVMELALKLGNLQLQEKKTIDKHTKDTVFWDSYTKSVILKYGYSKIKSVEYNKARQLMLVTLGSERSDFNQTIEVPVPDTHSSVLEEIILSTSFSPTVIFDVIKGKLKAKKIRELANSKEVVENREFKNSKNSIQKLNLFIEHYPKSKFVAKAHSTLQTLQKNKENKRLAKLELAKDNADGDIIGSKNFEGAQYKAGRIWQDQPINRRFDVLYGEAKKHCEALTLLNVKGWRLPSESDYKSLDQSFNDFAYVASKPGYFTPYFTRDENCVEGGFFPVERQNCVLTIYVNPNPKVMKAHKRKSRNSFRCVLSAYKYNKNAKKQALKYINENTLDGYINAFKASGDDSHIRKAFDLAQSKDELAKVEMALIQHFGLHKVLSLKGSLITQNGTDVIRDEIDASILLNMIASSGNADFKYEVFPTSNGIVPLKYGKYKVRLKIKLDLKYENTMEKGFFGMDFLTYETKSKEREFEVELTPDNNWKYSGTVDFGTIMHGAKGGAFIFKMNRSLKGIQPKFDLLSIERI